LYYAILELNDETEMKNTVNQLSNQSIEYWLASVESYFGSSYYNNLVSTLMQNGNSNQYWQYSLNEHHIYGSSRLGLTERNLLLARQPITAAEVNYISENGDSSVVYSYDSAYKVFYRGEKRYELSNHLGNVLAVITDRRIQSCDNGNVMHYEAQVVSISDYYPFGMMIQERKFDAVSYRFGFNGKELDDETYNGSIAFEARIYDARLGRFMSIDPLSQEYPWQSVYSYYLNSPISTIDVMGMGGEKEVLGDKVEVGEGPLNYARRNGLTGTNLSVLDQLAVNNPDKFMNYSSEMSNEEKIQYWNDGSGKNWNIDPGQNLVIASGNKQTESLTGPSLPKGSEYSTTEQSSLGLPDKKEGESQNSETDPFGLSLTALAGTAGLAEDVNKALLNSGKGISAYQLSKGKVQLNNVYRSNGALNGNKYFSGSTYMSRSTAVSRAVPVVNTIAVGYGVYQAVETGNNGYFFQALFSTAASYVPKVGTAVSIGISLDDPNNYRMTGGDMSVMPDGSSRWGNGGTTCFVKGTQVLMSDSSLKSIENVKKGEFILCVNIRTFEVCIDTVEQIPLKTNKYRKIFARYSNGVSNEFSPAHPFYVKNKGWSVFDINEAKSELSFTVSKLEIGDTLFFWDGNKLKETVIIELFDTDEIVEMYNVEHVKKL
jgi:RHS repeat-associated protein